MNSQIVNLLIHDNQGETTTVRLFDSEIRNYLKMWSSPENLMVSVTDFAGKIVGHKPMKRKYKIDWYE
jgi:hypothetical protein